MVNWQFLGPIWHPSEGAWYMLYNCLILFCLHFLLIPTLQRYLSSRNFQDKSPKPQLPNLTQTAPTWIDMVVSCLILCVVQCVCFLFFYGNGIFFFGAPKQHTSTTSNFQQITFFKIALEVAFF